MSRDAASATTAVSTSHPPTAAEPGRSWRQWRATAGLLLLSVVPMLGGSVRLASLAGGTPTEASQRFFDAPAPIVLHIVGATVFSVVGAFQFVPSLRRRRWHRRSGRVVLPAGLVAALTGVWMAVAYPWPPGDEASLAVVRVVVGVAMTASLVLGLAAIRRRDISAHRAWMMRGYALGLGAGTQVLTHLPWLAAGSPPLGWSRTLAMAAGWVINLAVAEVLIRRGRRPAGPQPLAPSGIVPTLAP